jgi:hypothetical protein
MKRVGLTNFVLWALPALIVGFPLTWDTATGVAVAVGALGVAWRTRFWPEGLGVAAGISGAFLLGGLWTVAFEHAVAPPFITAGLLFAATWVMWRARLSAYVAAHAGAEGAAPPSPNGTSRPWRLLLGVAATAAALVPVNVVMLFLFAGGCGDDTTPEPPPGSSLEAHCNFASDHAAALTLGPPLVVMGVGLVLACMRRPRLLLVTGMGGFGLSIALHATDWIVP